MQPNSIHDILQAQRAYFQSGATLPVPFRRAMLKRLYTAIQAREAEITAALQADLGKPAYESFMCEVGLSLTEITHMLRHLKGYAREHRVPTPLAQFPSRSFTKASPFVNVLIMSPWNYPFLLRQKAYQGRHLPPLLRRRVCQRRHHPSGHRPHGIRRRGGERYGLLPRQSRL